MRGEGRWRGRVVATATYDDGGLEGQPVGSR